MFSPITAAAFARFGTPADYYPQTGPGPIAVTAIFNKGKGVGGQTDSGVAIHQYTCDVRVSEIAQPVKGDVIEIEGRQFVVAGSPNLDREGEAWQLDLNVQA